MDKEANTREGIYRRSVALIALMTIITAASVRLRADTGTCGGAATTLPFTDVMGNNTFFCSIAQIYFQGITFGTSPTTYSPAAAVTREQMAAFLSRTLDATLKRGSERAARSQFWTTTPHYEITAGTGMLGTTVVSSDPQLVASDGADLWVANFTGDRVSRVRASDGKLLENWTGASDAVGVLVAMGRVFVTGGTSPGRIYMIDPSQPFGSVTVVATLGGGSAGIAFDGARIWTANAGNSISIVTPGSPFSAVNILAPPVRDSSPRGILFDGANMWVTNFGTGELWKLAANGTTIQTVAVGNGPLHPIFDGTNIWVPNSSSNSVTVVRPADGVVLATLTGNGLNGPTVAAFDGQRVLVTNILGESVSLWKAADLTPLGTVSTGANSSPNGACSDGLNFWITLSGPDQLARF